MPKVSILVAVYNGAQFLPQMLESVQKQTFTNYELVLVNDASKDNSLEIMQLAQKDMPNIKIITYDKNKTLPGALNTGLKECAGEYIFRLDADDLITADCLEKEFDFLQKNPEYDGVICDELKVDTNLNPKYKLLKLLDDYYIKKQNLFRTAYGGPTTMLKKQKYFEAGLHDERLKVSSDRAVAIDLHKITKIGHIPECLYIYREHTANISQNNTKFKQSKIFHQYINDHLKIFNKEDYINTPEMIETFLNKNAEYIEIRRIKYANVLLKCAIKLAQYGDKQAALMEIKNAELVHPRPAFNVFKQAIKLGLKKHLDNLYINMNAWTNYAYDDFLLTMPTPKSDATQQ